MPRRHSAPLLDFWLARQPSPQHDGDGDNNLVAAHTRGLQDNEQTN